MKKTIFYHAGRPVRMAAENRFARAMNPDRYEVDVVHFRSVPFQLWWSMAKSFIPITGLILAPRSRVSARVFGMAKRHASTNIAPGFFEKLRVFRLSRYKGAISTAVCHDQMTTLFHGIQTSSRLPVLNKHCTHLGELMCCELIDVDAK